MVFEDRFEQALRHQFGQAVGNPDHEPQPAGRLGLAKVSQLFAELEDAVGETEGGAAGLGEGEAPAPGGKKAHLPR